MLESSLALILIAVAVQGQENGRLVGAITDLTMVIILFKMIINLYL